MIEERLERARRYLWLAVIFSGILVLCGLVQVVIQLGLFLGWW